MSRSSQIHPGVILVGGVIVAAGVALYEHEPFRDWVDDTWRKTSVAFQDLADKLAPEAERRRRRETPLGAWSNHERDLGSNMAKRRQRAGESPQRDSAREHRNDSALGLDHGAGVVHAKTVLLENSQLADGLRNRSKRTTLARHEDSEPSHQPTGTKQELTSTKRVESPEHRTSAIGPGRSDQLEARTPTILTPSSHGSMTPYTPKTLAAQTPTEDRIGESQEYFSFLSHPRSPSTEASAHNDATTSSHDSTLQSQLTTAHLTAHNMSSSPTADEDLDIVSAPMSKIDDDARSDTLTETMSHVSIPQGIHDRDDDPGSSLGVCDVDDVMSVASSWSAVSSVDGRTLGS
ncbi:MAG: hypothetical protein M1828_002537 [Chrysothrix sp. TS-e1954]|nr:MAG: hypothetical protein M1828_002537 [Chrysothrix sp. TS-e1954]